MTDKNDPQRKAEPDGHAEPTPPHPRRGWKAELQAIIDANNCRKSDGRKIASHKTQDERAKALFRGFRDLRKLGYLIDNPRNLKPRHLEALFRHWEARGLSAATLQTQISFFRVFCTWIGKPDMVTASKDYVVDPASVRRTYAATEDKSWTAQGIDIGEVIRRVEAFSPNVAMQLKLVKAVFLRRKEAVMFHPFLADHGNYIVVEDGTKGQRPRVIPVETPEQRAVLDEAKAFVRRQGMGVNGHVGDPALSLNQNLSRYSRALTKAGITKKQAGVTGHGLRAEGVCDMLERHGVKAPVRGGRAEDVDPETREIAYRRVTRAAGHSRIRVVFAYGGNPNPRKMGTRRRHRARWDDDAEAGVGKTARPDDVAGPPIVESLVEPGATGRRPDEDHPRKGPDDRLDPVEPE